MAGGVQQVRAWIGKGNGGNKRGGGKGLASQGALGEPAWWGLELDTQTLGNGASEPSEVSVTA